MKKKYIMPRVRSCELDMTDGCLNPTSITSDEGLDYGGKASDMSVEDYNDLSVDARGSSLWDSEW